MDTEGAQFMAGYQFAKVAKQLDDKGITPAKLGNAAKNKYNVEDEKGMTIENWTDYANALNPNEEGEFADWIEVLKMRTNPDLPPCTLITEDNTHVGITVPFEVLEYQMGCVPDPSQLCDNPGPQSMIAMAINKQTCVNHITMKEDFPKEVNEVHKWQLISYDDPDNPTALNIYWR